MKNEESTDSHEPRLRRDAVTNAAKISRAADEAFAQRGLDVSMADVADLAGVGVGTVYRRFGSKDALIDTLFLDKVDEIVSITESAALGDDAGEAFLGFVSATCELLAGNKGLRQLMLGSTNYSAKFGVVATTRLMPRLRTLTDRAKAAGWLRESFAASDFSLILLAVHGVSDFAGDQYPDLWRRTLRMMIDGIRLGIDDEVDIPTPPPLTDGEVVTQAVNGGGR